jgi:probable rRNA maturation factor
LIAINTLVACPFTDSILKIARKVYRVEKKVIGTRKVSISLVSPRMIQKLNRNYRGKDKVTDVLSFPMDNSPLLDDIFICVQRAREQAREIGHSLERELQYLTVHGLYHLLGYDHVRKTQAQQMRAKEKFVMGDN